MKGQPEPPHGPKCTCVCTRVYTHTHRPVQAKAHVHMYTHTSTPVQVQIQKYGQLRPSPGLPVCQKGRQPADRVLINVKHQHTPNAASTD